jgi:hypothetical protein
MPSFASGLQEGRWLEREGPEPDACPWLGSMLVSLGAPRMGKCPLKTRQMTGLQRRTCVGLAGVLLASVLLMGAAHAQPGEWGSELSG